MELVFGYCWGRMDRGRKQGYHRRGVEVAVQVEKEWLAIEVRIGEMGVHRL